MIGVLDNDRTEFGEYLRRRRAAMPAPPPQDNARTSRRRVPGLRRQELSDIAGISNDYYIRLEQGKAPRPSREILAALARAFALSDAERDHLFRLAGELPPEPQAPGSEIRPGLLRLMRSLDDTMPVTVHDGRLDLLAVNAPPVICSAPSRPGVDTGATLSISASRPRRFRRCSVRGALNSLRGSLLRNCEQRSADTRGMNTSSPCAPS